jgi:hypothetical protein
MSTSDTGRPIEVYRIRCEDGHPFVVYNASAIGDPSDHVPGKWYARPYLVPILRGEEIVGPFDAAEDAERAVRALHRPSTTRQPDRHEGNTPTRHGL